MSKEYNHTGHKSISTNEYKVDGRNFGIANYIKQNPYVGEDGIYVPLEPYVQEGCSSNHKCIMTKEMFVEAYNKWIKND